MATPLIEEQLKGCFSIAEETPREVVAECRVPLGFSGFEGHFPGRPVLPAFCIIRLCVAIAARSLAPLSHLRTVARSRFLAPIEPGVPFTVRVSKTPVPGGGWRFRALLTSGDATAADVQFTLEQEKEGCDAASQA